jgi:hypothetical protein
MQHNQLRNSVAEKNDLATPMSDDPDIFRAFVAFAGCVTVLILLSLL